MPPDRIKFPSESIAEAVIGLAAALALKPAAIIPKTPPRRRPRCKAAYPSRGAEWLDESVPLDPPANGLSVLAAEKAVQTFVDRGGRGIALRFAEFYGSDASQTPLMARSIKSGWAPMPGKRSFYISSVSHDDAANR
jgi:hypothetical protein